MMGINREDMEKGRWHDPKQRLTVDKNREKKTRRGIRRKKGEGKNVS